MIQWTRVKSSIGTKHQTSFYDPQFGTTTEYLIVPACGKSYDVQRHLPDQYGYLNNVPVYSAKTVNDCKQWVERYENR